jgi:hypothetical protein
MKRIPHQSQVAVHDHLQFHRQGEPEGRAEGPYLCTEPSGFWPEPVKCGHQIAHAESHGSGRVSINGSEPFLPRKETPIAF